MNSFYRSLPAGLTALTIVLYAYCASAQESGSVIPAATEPPKTEVVKETPKLDPATQKKLRNDIVYRASLGRASDIAVLIEKGASANEVNNSGVPLLALAAARPDDEGIEVVKVLVESGADVNKTDSRGQNALFYAAKAGNKAITEYLMVKKINHIAVDKFGNTARTLAYQTGQHEVVAAMDNFIRWQNDMIRQKNLETHKVIDAQIKDYTETLQMQMQQDGEAVPQLQSPPPEQGSVQDITYKLSFASCASSYWQFCSSVKQPSEFGTQEMQSNIAAHDTRVKEFSARLWAAYKVGEGSISNIVSVSAEKIKAELSAYPSNDARREYGIGTVNDMNARCGKIANIWVANIKTAPSTDPLPAAMQPSRRPSTNILPSL